MEITDHTKQYLEGAITVIEKTSQKEINTLTKELIKLKKRQGRLFFLGVGGSAANCSHAVNDFRKICNIETYTPTDNVAELTARTNDDGWNTTFASWLKGSHLNKKDAIFILSVGGGNIKTGISANIVEALKYAQNVNATILGIVSRNGGYTKKVATASVLIPTIDQERITPYAESFQGLIWHGIVNCPNLIKDY